MYLSRPKLVLIASTLIVIIGISAYFLGHYSSTDNEPESNQGVSVSGKNGPDLPSKKTTAELLEGMQSTFDEEFNSLSFYLGPNNNTACNSSGTGIWETVFYFCSRTIYSNGENEIYTDKQFLDYYTKKAGRPLTSTLPFSINNGILQIKAAPADSTITKASGDWAKYTSGLLTTEYSFSQTYGYFEMRAILPTGQGVWPAFWLLPVDKSWPPEIDILESFGGENQRGEGGSTMIHYASHISKDTFCGGWFDTGVDVTKNFHVYGVDWEPNGTTYYFDGKPYAWCSPNPEANKPFYILLNMAVGGPSSWPGAPDSSNVWPANMYIDYIKAYQNKSAIK